MAEGSGEVEDELIDLNKEPFERKRKRVEKNNSTDKGNEGSDSLPKSGRVLRSRTVAMSDGEKQVIKMEIVKMRDKEEGQVTGMEDKDEGQMPVLHKRKKMKGRRGRPPKTEGKREVSSLSHQKKRRGRPPKTEGKGEVSSLSYRKKDVKVVDQKRVDESSNGVGRGRGRFKVKRKRGRPRKVGNVNMELVIKEKNVKRNRNRKKSANGGPVKRLKADRNDLENGFVRQEKVMAECAEGQELGLREQKQLVRDQIVSMLKKAGWTIEYRLRQSKDYQDAVYVDREGRTHWSCTLAYRKLKEKIDEGKADGIDVAAFSPIPEETFSMLFRNTEKGRKAGKRKNGAGKFMKRTMKKESSKSKSLDGRTKSRLKQGKQRTLLARRPRDESDNDNYELYEGKRSLLSWMIDLGTVPFGGKVKYKRGRTKKILLEGRIMREGICCDCCNITHTVWGFESHAKSTLGQPYQNIYLDSGNSLFQCLVDSWKKHVETDNIGFVCVDVEGDDPNDDTCNVCGDGGDLICCDSCPSTFHNGCLHINVPSGDWHCIYCSCKFCGMASGSTSTNDGESDSSSELFTCRLCEEKFHVDCIKGIVAEDFDDENPSFCGEECLKIFEQLQVLLGVRHELEEGFSYTILQYRGISGDGGDGSLNDDDSKVESNSKLAVAFTVMDECFEPIIDERSGTNMIHNVVYSCGSNIRRLNYDGFYTIILEKGDELVSAASIRIHGSKLAEMPFIGTRFMYRRQGMCSRLLNATETILYSLGVEKLVIPAISELNETWTKIFGFFTLEESKREEMRYMSMIVFPGIDMLEKPLVGHHIPKRQKDSAVTERTEVRDEHQNMEENPASASSTCSDVNIQDVEEAAAESNEVQTPHQNTQEEQSKDTVGPAAPNVDISPEVDIHTNDKEAAAGSVLSEADTDVRAVNADESCDSSIRLNDLNTSEDKNLKADTCADCNIEAQKSTEESTCPNGILPDNGEIVY